MAGLPTLPATEKDIFKVAGPLRQAIEFINRNLLIGQHVGTNTNDNAAAGNVGEYIEGVVVSGSAVAFATGTAKTVTSISLTAGDWDVSGTLYFKGGATTTVQYLFACTSATTDSADLTPGAFVEATYNSETPFAVLAQVSQNLSPRRVSLSTTTTYYLVGLTGFGVSTNSGFGIISARRVR